MTDLQKINDSGQLDLNFSVDGEEKAEGYVQLDLNMQAKGSPQVPSDFGSQNPVSSYYKSHSVETELDQDNTRRTKIDYDQEKTQSPCSEHDCVRTQSPNQGEMVEFSGSYFDKCSPDFRAQTVHHERGTEGSAPSQESPLPEDNNQKEETECNSNIDPPYTSARVEKVKGARFENSNYEFKKSSVNDIEGEDIEHQAGILSSHSRSPSVDGAIEQIEDYNSLRDSPAEGRDLDMPHSVSQCDGRTRQHSTSPVAVKSMLVSPFASPLSTPEGVQERLHSTSPLRQKDPYSPKPSDVAKRTSRCDNLSPSATRTRTSRRDNLSPSATRTRTSPKRSRRTRGSPVKRLSASPEPHRLPQRYERNNRQMSRSPIRRRDPTSGYGRDYHDRYRSRSPHARDHYRSQRQRYSPRRRSPGYHSRRHSPRRRPWSPPPNRRTGLGIPGKDIFVAGFSFLTTERDLERKFSRFGRVRDVRIVRDKRSGDSRGFGFMSMEKDEEADAAIRALDETEWNGRIILVEKSKSTG